MQVLHAYTSVRHGPVQHSDIRMPFINRCGRHLHIPVSLHFVRWHPSVTSFCEVTSQRHFTKNERLLGLDPLLDNTDKSSKHMVMRGNKMHRIPLPNHIECYKAQVTPFMFYLCHTVQTFCQFCSKASCFRANSNFETNAPNDLKMALNSLGQRVPIQFFSLCSKPFLRWMPFWEMCITRPQNNL